jgi:hypothetical protein
MKYFQSHLQILTASADHDLKIMNSHTATDVATGFLDGSKAQKITMVPAWATVM